MNITAKELSGNHIGKTVTVKAERFPYVRRSPLRDITGTITGIMYDSRIIPDERLFSETVEVLVHCNAVHIEIDEREWVEINLDRDPEITIQEEQ